jgi:hypothetical protein
MTQEFHYCKHCAGKIAFDAIKKLWYHTDGEGKWWLNCQGLTAMPQW